MLVEEKVFLIKELKICCKGNRNPKNLLKQKEFK